MCPLQPATRARPLQACGTYLLNYVNDQAEWPEGVPASQINGIHTPTVTNLHLHGLHISGESPGDDVLTQIEPGETGEYT